MCRGVCSSSVVVAQKSYTSSPFCRLSKEKIGEGQFVHEAPSEYEISTECWMLSRHCLFALQHKFTLLTVKSLSSEASPVTSGFFCLHIVVHVMEGVSSHPRFLSEWVTCVNFFWIYASTQGRWSHNRWTQIHLTFNRFCSSSISSIVYVYWASNIYQ